VKCWVLKPKERKKVREIVGGGSEGGVEGEEREREIVFEREGNCVCGWDGERVCACVRETECVFVCEREREGGRERK